MVREEPFHPCSKVRCGTSMMSTAGLSYSMETYRVGNDKYVAVTSDTMKCRVYLGEGNWKETQQRPLAQGNTRKEAVKRLVQGIEAITKIDSAEHVVINIRDHDEYACYYCMSFPKFERYEDWLSHLLQTHVPQRIDLSDIAG